MESLTVRCLPFCLPLGGGLSTPAERQGKQDVRIYQPTNKNQYMKYRDGDDENAG